MERANPFKVMIMGPKAYIRQGMVYHQGFSILGLSLAVILVLLVLTPKCQAVSLTINATNGSVNGPEKILQFFENSADSNHIASPTISTCSSPFKVTTIRIIRIHSKCLDTSLKTLV